MSGHQERGLLMNRDLVVVLGLDIKINLVGALFAGIRRHSNNDGHFMIFGTGDIQPYARRAISMPSIPQQKSRSAWLFSGVHDLEVVDILDPAIIRLTGQSTERSRITSTLSGTRVASDQIEATVMATRIVV
jgi:hypothetical protein